VVQSRERNVSRWTPFVIGRPPPYGQPIGGSEVVFFFQNSTSGLRRKSPPFYTSWMEGTRPGNPSDTRYKIFGNTTSGGGDRRRLLAEWTYNFQSGQLDRILTENCSAVEHADPDHTIQTGSIRPPYDAERRRDYGRRYMKQAVEISIRRLATTIPRIARSHGEDDPHNPLQSGSEGADRYSIPAEIPCRERRQIPRPQRALLLWNVRNPHTFLSTAIPGTHPSIGRRHRSSSSNVEEVDLVHCGHKLR